MSDQPTRNTNHDREQSDGATEQCGQCEIRPVSEIRERRDALQRLVDDCFVTDEKIAELKTLKWVLKNE